MMSKGHPISRRNLLIASGAVIAGATLTQLLLGEEIGCSRRKIESLETELLRDFLKYTPESPLDKSNIEELLYDIKAEIIVENDVRGNTKGRAVNIGDGYYLTAFHVVDPRSVRKGESLKLIPQFRRGYINDFAQGFEIAHYDKKSDLALLKTQVERKTGKARIHLAPYPQRINDAVSMFILFSGKPRQITYEFELVGRNYYNSSNNMSLGKFILPAGSLLFENQGWVLVYDRDYIHKRVEGDELLKAKDGHFSSIMSESGDSGSPVFVRLRDGRYIFAGVVSGLWQISHMIETPGHPLTYDAMSQRGTVFAHREPIARLITNYNPNVMSNQS